MSHLLLFCCAWDKIVSQLRHLVCCCWCKKWFEQKHVRPRDQLWTSSLGPPILNFVRTLALKMFDRCITQARCKKYIYLYIYNKQSKTMPLLGEIKLTCKYLERHRTTWRSQHDEWVPSKSLMPKVHRRDRFPELSRESRGKMSNAGKATKVVGMRQWNGFSLSVASFCVTFCFSSSYLFLIFQMMMMMMISSSSLISFSCVSSLRRRTTQASSFFSGLSTMLWVWLNSD